MKHTDTTPWTAGHIAGQHRGQQDATAEAAGRYTRDPDHTGHPDLDARCARFEHGETP